MSDQTPSGNRWEPTADQPDAQPVQPAASAPPAPPPAAVVPERHGRWRAVLRRPGQQSWIAAALSAVVVLVGLGGFLLGRASVDEPSPTQVGQQWRHGPGDGDLPDRGFAPGDQDGDQDGSAPGGLPGTQS